MAEKLKRCCFCERECDSQWGAICEGNENYLCIDCVLLMYNGVAEKIGVMQLDKGKDE